MGRKRLSGSQSYFLYLAAIAIVYVAIYLVNLRPGEFDATGIIFPSMLAGGIIYYILRKKRQNAQSDGQRLNENDTQ